MILIAIIQESSIKNHHNIFSYLKEKKNIYIYIYNNNNNNNNK